MHLLHVRVVGNDLIVLVGSLNGYWIIRCEWIDVV